jgi:alkaline phosphatase D
MLNVSLRRRSFLKTLSITAGATTIGCGPSNEGGGDPAGVFPLSVCSGDPRADSIVLWTRIESTETMAMVELQVATDEAFSQRVTLSESMLLAAADHDYCLRVKVGGLSAATRYYYRFRYQGTNSRVGRFKTAPAAGTDTPVKLVLASCQDYVGRYYNAYLKLLEAEYDDVDAVLHIGDYIYETTGDPSFMMASEDRGVKFDDQAGAIARTEAGATYYSARSLSNYRQLYKIYRSDPVLQQVHEKFPFIVIWDDHEFSDDCFGDTTTMYGGAVADEKDMERRLNAEQAFLEFQPLCRDLEEGTGALEDQSGSSLYPMNKIYRDFRFGKNVHLVMTDYRSFRPDHPVPESSWPGALAMDQTEVQAQLTAWETAGKLPTGQTAATALSTAFDFRPYIDLRDADFAMHKAGLVAILAARYKEGGATDAYSMELATTATSGFADATVVDATLADADYQKYLPDPLKGLPATVTEGLPLGLSYGAMGKFTLFGPAGARYVLRQPLYDFYFDYRVGKGEIPNPLGDTQYTHLKERVTANADAAWTVWVSSVSMAPMLVDLTIAANDLPAGFPADMYYLNGDQWDGFPSIKEKILEEVLRPRNALILSGDIHGCFVADHGLNQAGTGRAIEMTGPAISSGNFRELLRGTAEQIPGLKGNERLGTLIDIVDSLMQAARPQTLKYARTNAHGVLLLTIDSSGMQGDYLLYSPPATAAATDVPPVKVSYYEDPTALAPLWEKVTFKSARTAGVNAEIKQS